MTNNSGIKRWGKHPISLGILAGVIFGSAYFLSNALPEEEGSTTIPLNTAQLEKTAPEAQSEVGAPSVQEASDLEAPNSETPAAAVPAAPEIAFSFEETATPAKPAQNSLASVAKASAKSSQERPTQSVDKAPDPVQVTAAAVAQDVSSLSTAVLESQEPSLASGARGYLSDRSPSEQRRPAVEAPLVAYSPGDEPTEMDLTDDEPIAYEPVEKEAPQHPSKSVIKTAEAPQSSPKPASKVETKLKAQEAQLLAQQGQPRYTLQLLAASNEDNIKQFINRHGIQDKTRYFKTKRAGKDWFVVVYGNYDSKQEANAAASRFATSFKSTNLQPWVRQLSAVQAEVSKSQG